MLCLNVCELRGVLIDQVHISRRPFLNRTYKNFSPVAHEQISDLLGGCVTFLFSRTSNTRGRKVRFRGARLCAFEILGRKQRD